MAKANNSITANQIWNFLQGKYGNNAGAYYSAWKLDTYFWNTLLSAHTGDTLIAPMTNLGGGVFILKGSGFDFVGNNDLYEYQGNGPYTITGPDGHSNGISGDIVTHPVCTDCSDTTTNIDQPIYDYSSGVPIYTGFNRVVNYHKTGSDFIPGSDSLPWVIGGPIGASEALSPVGWAISATSTLQFLNNSENIYFSLQVSIVDKRTYLNAR
jgi:hypothetical protein